MKTAHTILAQLGGNAFVAMTGAHDILGDAKTLQFKVGRGAKGRISCVRVTLDPSDTYTIAFYAGKGLNIREVGTTEGVHADSLRRVFTEKTGFDCTL